MHIRSHTTCIYARTLHAYTRGHYTHIRIRAHTTRIYARTLHAYTRSHTTLTNCKCHTYTANIIHIPLLELSTKENSRSKSSNLAFSIYLHACIHTYTHKHKYIPVFAVVGCVYEDGGMVMVHGRPKPITSPTLYHFFHNQLQDEQTFKLGRPLWPLQAGMIGFITFPQSVLSQVTLQDSNASRKH
jgi:hypothetical protein